jgi:hypothetical protein
MSSKSKALSLEIVQEFTEAMTLLGDERGLAFPPARELQRILPGIQGMERGKLSMAEMVEQFPVWGAKAFQLALEAYGNMKSAAGMGFEGEDIDLLADAQTYVERSVLPSLEMRLLQAPTAAPEAMLLRRIEELEEKLRRGATAAADTNGGVRLEGGGASARKAGGRCYRWDGSTCPFGDGCRFKSAHTPGVDSRGRIGDEGAPTCRDFAAGRCVRGDSCRFKHN